MSKSPFPDYVPTKPHEAAYPYEFRAPDGKVRRSSGMTLREAFAMAAMQGLIVSVGAHPATAEEVARRAAACADALIAELAKSRPS